MLKFKTILLACFLLACNFTTFGQKKTQSVLSSGDIFKFSVQNTGVYKLDYSQLQEVSELNIDVLDPRKIHVYTTNGGSIPQKLSDTRIDDLTDLPIQVIGEEDSSFDPSDYILFYMEGADKYDFSRSDLSFNRNIYDDKNYFFLKVESTNGPRIQDTPGVQNIDFVSSSSESVKRYDQDRLNLLGNFGGTQGSGKVWYGESFANEPNQSFGEFFNFPKLEPGEAEIEISFASRSERTTRYDVNIDGQTLNRSISRTDPSDIEAIYANIGTIREKILLSSGTPNVDISYLKSESADEGWLDYIEIIARERLEYTNEPLFIFDRNSHTYSTFGFNISNGTGLNIWDISSISQISSMTPTTSGSSVTFSYSVGDKLKSFVVFDNTDISLKPVYIGKTENQNLHSIQRADLIIVYYKDFKEAAEKLAMHRNQNDNMIVEVVDVEKIYNEFGGINQPASIRDFAKMIFDRDSNFKYLLLLGDGTYDFRGLVPELEYQNFVPTYQTEESLHPVEAFPSDDFYALLSDDEGGDSLDGDLDIGVGRVPAKTLDEALGVIDKIIHYDTNKNTLGDWRLRIGFTADDEDSNLHVRQADGIAELTQENHPILNQQKVYFDAFNQEATPGGARYPDANNALNSNLNNGQLVLNYLGHGGPKGWAQERVFQISDIVNLKNINRLPVMITATCSFTGFDEPSFVSAGEQALLNPIGGAVALFSTVRAVYSSQNKRLTEEIFKKIFTKNNGEALRLGDIIRLSQNANSTDQISSNTRKFLLFGDPSQKLALPKYNISVSEVNGEPIVENQIDTVGALGKMSLKGNIEDHNGTKLSSFNGQVFLTVYDKANNLKTLNNDNIPASSIDFTLRKNILYKGSATVNSGEFEIEFVLPKDINFDFGPGHLSFYATDNIRDDAGGMYDNLIIGGTSKIGIDDNEGPDIKIFLEDRSFVFGGQTKVEPLLLIDLSDENGINLSSTSIGHDITAILDNDQNNALILNDFYQPTLDMVGAGSLEYQLSKLEPGLHTIKVKAWDILNNSSEQITEFLVVENESGLITNVFNYPNPFSTNTNFRFEHDLNNANLDIVVNIYTVSGQLVKTIQAQRFSSGPLIDDISWNGRDGFESKLAKGIYFYKININSPELNLSRESDFQKLVILN